MIKINANGASLSAAIIAHFGAELLTEYPPEVLRAGKYKCDIAQAAAIENTATAITQVIAKDVASSSPRTTLAGQELAADWLYEPNVLDFIAADGTKLGSIVGLPDPFAKGEK